MFRFLYSWLKSNLKNLWSDLISIKSPMTSSACLIWDWLNSHEPSLIILPIKYNWPVFAIFMKVSVLNIKLISVYPFKNLLRVTILRLFLKVFKFIYLFNSKIFLAILFCTEKFFLFCGFWNFNNLIERLMLCRNLKLYPFKSFLLNILTFCFFLHFI